MPPRDQNVRPLEQGTDAGQLLSVRVARIKKCFFNVKLGLKKGERFLGLERCCSETADGKYVMDVHGFIRFYIALMSFPPVLTP